MVRACGREPARAVAVLLLTAVAGCAGRVPPPVATPPVAGEVSPGYRETGQASWYGEPYHGRRTASGEIYDMHKMTAAHRTLPFGTMVEVRRRDTGDRVTVRITDRGPFVKGRIVDLSYAAARVIGLDVDGVAPVTLEVVAREQAASPPQDRPSRAADLAESDCLWVQVGAFSDAANAARAQRRLVDAGETVVVVDGADGLARIRVGPFARRPDAAQALARVQREWPAARLVECGR